MHRMRALITLDPAQAKKDIIAAFVAEDAHFEHTANELGVSVKGLYRWVEELGIADEFERIKEKKAKTIAQRRASNGHLGGRPKENVRNAQRSGKKAIKGGKPPKARRRRP